MVNQKQKLEMQLKQAKAIDFELSSMYVGKNVLFNHKNHRPLYGQLVKAGENLLLIKDVKEINVSMDHLLEAESKEMLTYIQTARKLPDGIYNQRDISEMYQINIEDKKDS